MLSVIIRTQNGERVLLDTLRPLIAAAADGIVRDVVFLDVGSQDGTAQIADAAGASFLRPTQTDVSATHEALETAHRAAWILLIDQTTVLAPGWIDETISFVERQDRVKTQRGLLSGVYRPEHAPEVGSADVRRRMAILVANRLLSKAKLSQGIVIRRTDLAQQKVAQWGLADPSFQVPNLLRLRSRTYLAQPLPPLEELSAPKLADGNLSGATP